MKVRIATAVILSLLNSAFCFFAGRSHERIRTLEWVMREIKNGPVSHSVLEFVDRWLRAFMNLKKAK